MSYVQARRRRMKKRPQGHRGFAPMGDTSSLPDYCSPYSANYFQTNWAGAQQAGATDYAQALQTCASSSSTACQQQADQNAGNIAAAATDVQANWNPATDDFKPDDVMKIVNSMTPITTTGADQIINAMDNLGTDSSDKGGLRDYLDTIGAIQTQMDNYRVAVNKAKALGAAATVHAPGLKDWVVSSITAIAQGAHFGTLVLCSEPWWAGVMSTLFGVVRAVAAIVKAVVSVAVALVTKSIDAVEGGLDMIAVLEKIAPFAAIGLAAWWLFLREKKRGGGGKVFAL